MIKLIKCDEACLICDKAQYKEAILKDKLRLILHLISCKYCRSYVRNNKKLTRRVQSGIGELSAQEKKEIQLRIEKELKMISTFKG